MHASVPPTATHARVETTAPPAALPTGSTPQSPPKFVERYVPLLHSQ